MRKARGAGCIRQGFGGGYGSVTDEGDDDDHDDHDDDDDEEEEEEEKEQRRRSKLMDNTCLRLYLRQRGVWEKKEEMTPFNPGRL
ncbi:hypothetical protein E2C01_071110 [Portunus trituberculatus]|uniref:Uncharacterized protein n=1 Tax=Portunus trituberculatus TaxID=210409 RepID=A0A5B7I3Z2_PORTR|nr:hypothetical protein [Portunus trituberculatus]